MAAPLAGHHVAVLLGGLSSEREVSLVSGAACADALERLGARVSRIDAGRDLAQVLSQLKPDVCFNALHGAWGEDGCVQGVLETLGVPYTHSGVLASALAMDKAKAKAVLAAAGVTVPGGGLYDRFEVARRHVLPPPYVVKPNAEGSSVGVFLVFEGANSPPQEVIAPDWTFGEEVMVEPYIPGRELAAGVKDGKGMTVTEIIPRTGFYDYEAKYGEGGSVHVCPAEIPAHVIEKSLKLSEMAHAALGCRGVTRSDLRYDDINDVLVLLEVNTQPGMTPTSLIPEQAAKQGVGFDDLVLWITEDAYARGSAGGPRVQANPRAKAQAGPRGKRSAAPRPAAQRGQETPQGFNLSPKAVLVAAAGVLVLALGVTLATGHRGERLVEGFQRGVDARFAHAGFRLKKVHVQGASPMATADIVKAAGVYLDQPMVGLDLQAVRQKIEGVGWVSEVRVVRLLPDTLVLSVKERRRLAVWQRGGKTVVIDDQGQVIAEADPGRFATLPLVVGEGAGAAAPTILPLLVQRPKLMGRTDALVRVDNRRWDVRLKDGSLIQLPATNEEQALMQLEQLDARSHILDLGFDRIDLRNPELVAVRPRQADLAGRPAVAGA